MFPVTYNLTVKTLLSAATIGFSVLKSATKVIEPLGEGVSAVARFL